MGYLTKELPQELQELPVDVFLSYSQGAFAGQSNSELKRWSHKLAADLREELHVSGIDDLSLFLDESERRDEGVDVTADLSAQLQAHVEQAAILVALLSPQYLKSRWCAQEREWWLARHRPDRLAVGGRLFPCRVQPVPAQDFPPEFEGLLGYAFYDEDKDPTVARPFTYRGSTGDLDRYNDALIRLAGDVAQRLKAIREKMDERHRLWQQQQKAQASSGQILYLYGRERAAPAWSAACERLQHQRYVVNPDQPVPLADTGGLDPESRSQLAFSDGLLILGTEDGRALDSDMVVVGRRYRHLAISRRQAPLPCAVFDTVGAAAQDERRLRNAASLGISWIDGTRTDWPTQVQGWLRDSA